MVERDYGKGKEIQMNVRLSREAHQGLKEKAKALNLTLGALQERIGRGEIGLADPKIEGELSAS